MTTVRVLVRRLTGLFTRRRAERDLDEEIHDHLERLAADYEHQGLSPAEARLAARRAFGGVQPMKAIYRDRHGLPALEDLARDFRHAARALRRAPAFTGVAVLTLALGIGATTAIFSVIEALLLRTLPVRDPQQLVLLEDSESGLPVNLSYPLVQELARRDVFDGLFGFNRVSQFTVGEPGALERVSVALVTGSYYDVLGLRPAAGRLIRPDDDRPGAEPVIVLSHGYWQREFGGDPAIVGRSIPFEGVAVTIAGVSPPGFTGVVVGRVADLTLPLGILPQVRPSMAPSLAPNAFNYYVMARLGRGASAEDMSARLATVWPELAGSMSPGRMRDRFMAGRVELAPGGTGWAALRQRFSKPLLVLMAMVSVILLIACSNVANLLMARASSRHRELLTRLALGAGRMRVMREFLVESVLLSTAGALLGVGLAWLGSGTLLSIIQTGETTPVAIDVSPDGRVLAFAAGLAVATALLFGLVPAWRSAGIRVSTERREWGRVHSRGRFGHALVAVQVALSLLLLVAGGLFVRTLQNLRTLDAGFRHDDVLTVQVSPPNPDMSWLELNAFLEQVRGGLSRVPGVAEVAFGGALPLSGGSVRLPATVNGRTAVSEPTLTHFVAPGFLGAMRIVLRAGRDFAAEDSAEAPLAVIVNDSFARAYLAGVDPLSQSLILPGRDLPRRVVGVVADTVHNDLRTPPPPAVYLPFAQMSTVPAGYGAGTFAIVVPPGFSGVNAIRSAIAPYAPGPPVEIQSMTAQVERTLVQERLMALLAGAFAVVAVLLSAIGLYGLLSYAVTQRTNELGVRAALGAKPRDVIALVVRDAAWLVAAGVAVGLPLAWLAGRTVRTMLFRLEPGDPWNLAAALAVLVLAALAAAWLPARRATRVDPLLALRAE